MSDVDGLVLETVHVDARNEKVSVNASILKVEAFSSIRARLMSRLRCTSSVVNKLHMKQSRSPTILFLDGTQNLSLKQTKRVNK